MPLADADRELVEAELGRPPSRAEDALFENLWSEHCAYRSSRPLLSAFDSEGEQVVVGPGDDAAVLALDDDWCVTFGVESHNHPSYVDPYDGAATGVGGIVRDTLSMGAYPIALADSLYFGDFDDEHSRYLLDGVVEGIGDYGNAIGVPTVTGSTQFHERYEGNPLVNVACVGLLPRERIVTAEAQDPGNKLVLVGNGTGRDGLGGASFASEDLAEDAETEDRPAVQVGDPYTEKLLVEANEELVDGDLVESARDLGAAGLGGASCELVAKGGLGCEIELTDVHQREPDMTALEILLAESQERMVYEVTPENVARVEEIAAKYDLGCSVVGTLTDSGRYVATFEGETVVDAPAEFAADGAPMNDLAWEEPPAPSTELPDIALGDAADAVLSDPNTAEKSWVFRQYDHEVGVRTSEGPGEDSALLAIRETGQGLALSAGTNPYWTSVDPYAGAYATAVENATNLAAVGAKPLAAVDCLNGGNPEKPDVYGGFRAIVDGLADGCAALDTPVVGGNVSLYNDSVTGAIPPTPTLAVMGVRDGYDAPGTALEGEAALVLVGGHDDALGGSAYLANADGTEGPAGPTDGWSEGPAGSTDGWSDAFPDLDGAAERVDGVRAAALHKATVAVHDVSDGGLLVTLAEMVGEAGADVDVPSRAALFSEAPGRAVVATTDPDGLAADIDVETVVLGEATADATLTIDVSDEGETLDYAVEDLEAKRDVLGPALD